MANAPTAAAPTATAAAPTAIGTIPKNDATTVGSAQAEANAGATEATLLAARAIGTLAGLIWDRIKDEAASYLLFTGFDWPDLTDLALFTMQHDICTKSFDAADRDFDDAMALAGPQPRLADFALSTLPATIGTILQNAASLASYFRTDYTFQTLKLSGLTDDLLRLSVAQQALTPDNSKPARTVHLAGHQPPATAIDAKLQALLPRHARSQVEADQATALADKLAATAPAPTEAIDALRKAATQHQVAQKLFSDFLQSLLTRDSEGRMMLDRVKRQAALKALMDTGPLLVFVHLAAVSGESQTRTGLFRGLLEPPIYLSGGAVACFLATDSAGVLKAAGQFQAASGYLSPDQAAGLLRAPTPNGFTR